MDAHNPVKGETLQQMREDWNRRAREDAFYYVAFAHPRQDIEGFKATAGPFIPMLEIELLRFPLERRSQLAGLEIGCGPGRLMLALSKHFRELHGVDVSDEMIRLSRDVLSGISNAHTHATNGADLQLFQDDCFDFIYSYAVFQHIPEKEVVRNYLNEARRVLKPGGVFKAQFHGLQQSATPDTWSGCSFSSEEIRQSASENGFILLAVSGEGSQYLWATMRKPQARPDRPQYACPVLLDVTSPDGGRSIPVRGRGAALSFWLAGVTDEDGLDNFEIHIGARPQYGCYLGAIGPAGGTHLNSLLPRGMAPGLIPVSLEFNGRLLGRKDVTIVDCPRSPRIVSVSDALNRLSESRIECGKFKAILEDVESPGEVSFLIADRPAAEVSFQCLDPYLDQYYFTATLPGGVSKGTQTIEVHVSSYVLKAEVEIA